MTNQLFDSTSPHSILNYAQDLYGKTLNELVRDDTIFENVKNKGDLGSMVERLYFKINPGNDHTPDFANAGVELKTTGVVLNNKGVYRAKERLVLTMINYMGIISEEFEESSLILKCQLMLLLFYLYEKNVPVYNRTFILKPLLFQFPDEDLQIIKQDWQTIQQKIKDGKAHELSEGDTFYLGACRKGAGGISEHLRTQPNSIVGAKARAFSLKPSYMNRVIQRHLDEEPVLNESIVAKYGIEEATLSLFRPFLNMTIEELSQLLKYPYVGKNHKGFYREISLRMLGVVGRRTMPELEKAGIELKVIRLKSSGMPNEAMSFPAFKYLDIIHERWEESAFFNKLEKKFLFVIFQDDSDGLLHFKKAKYWNMPYEAREEAHRVWKDTQRRVLINPEDLPKASESWVAHVRPKAQNALDTYPTPQGGELVKKCFWLNSSYIKDQVV